MIGMKGLKNISCVVLIFFCNGFLFAQSGLLDFYSQLGFSHHENSSLGNEDLRTSNYYPLRATNYNWNVPNSTWDFADTTLYTYTSQGLAGSLTKKDSFNNFITRTLNSYDASNHLIETLNQYWSSGWVNNNRDTFAFDSYNNLTLQENLQWNTSQWLLTGGYTYYYTYSAGGKILTKLTLTWNTSTLVWDTVSRITNTYNAGNQVTQIIGESYNLSLMAWQLISKKNFTYDASFVNTQTVDYQWSGTQWDNNTQLINIVWSNWTGDVNTSNPQSYIYQLWNGSSWDNYNRLTYAYDAFGSVIQLTELWASGNWRDDSRLSDFYDNQFNYTGIRSESWNIFTTAWDTSYEYKYIYTYDVNNAITDRIYQEYDVFNHVFQNNSRTVYSDFIFLDVGVNSLAIANPAVTIYPNPVTDFAEVSMPGNNSLFQYRVYNSAGKLMAAGEEKKNNFRIYKAGLAEGLYLLLISNGQGAHHILKFIVQ